MTTQPTNRRCTATCADGSPCRAWAVRTSDPPRCSAHGGGSAPVGAPRGNQNARTHGFYARLARCGTTSAFAAQGELCSPTIDGLIADLFARQQALSHYLDRHAEDLPPAMLGRLLNLYFQASSRLGRLLRDRLALVDAANVISPAVAAALDQLGEDWDGGL